jgi:arylformamidase
MSDERLDALLDVRRRVPDFLAYTDRFAERSAFNRTRRSVHLDVPYGPHPRQRLDVFLPDRPEPAPAVLFYHGGYWRSSEKERYSFLAEAFLPAGVACVVVEYALIPDVDMDELVRQCRASLAHVHRNAAELGIDPARLHVAGHSAGGQIVGMLMAAGWHGAFDLPADIVRSGCGISGLYDLDPIRRSYLNDTLALDAASAARNSPCMLRPATDAHLLAAVGSLEGEEFLRQNGLIAEAWGSPVTGLVLKDDNHYSAVEAFADPASPLVAAFLAHVLA